MIALIEKPDRFCIVRWIGKVSMLTVAAVSYCGEQVDAGDGVMQLPDAILQEGRAMPGARNAMPRKVCPTCKAKMGG